MKNKYFGDKRDFFKYCFLLELLGAGIGAKRLAFIPLLTPNDGRGDGSVTGYDVGEYGGHRDLWVFLQGCLARGDRRLTNLRRFMASAQVNYAPYCDDSIFTHAGREAYFAGIPDSSLHDSVVFFDPDNGFEVPSTRAGNGDKFLRYEELASVMRRMSGKSVAIVYQHIPRVDRPTYFADLAAKVVAATGASDVFIVSDNVIAFVVISKDPRQANALKSALERYAGAHRLICWSRVG